MYSSYLLTFQNQTIITLSASISGYLNQLIRSFFVSETDQTKSGYLVLMSKLCFDDSLPIRFIYKTVPEHLNDTGWRMYTGYESEEYLANELANMLPVPLDTASNMDSSLDELLIYNAGTVWERTPENEQWQRVYDFKIPSSNIKVNITNDVNKFNTEVL